MKKKIIAYLEIRQKGRLVEQKLSFKKPVRLNSLLFDFDQYIVKMTGFCETKKKKGSKV